MYSYYRYEAFIGGSSHWSGPNFGIVINTPALFFAGLLKVHSVGFPRVESHAGLINVNPTGAVRQHSIKV